MLAHAAPSCPAVRAVLRAWSARPASASQSEVSVTLQGVQVSPRRAIPTARLTPCASWRRLSRDYEHLPEVSEAMVTLAMIRLMLHRTAHPNRKRLPAP